MSRSIGDYKVHEVGVTAEPEITQWSLKKCHVAVVIGTDGLFEFLSNEQIAKLLVPFHRTFDCGLAANALVTEAFQQWKSRK